MRTTLTLDPDVARALKTRAEEKNATFKQVVNETLRQGLSVDPGKKRKAFRVTPHSFGFRAGIDPYKLGKLADELDVPAFIARAPGRKKRA
jgi:hypothetical protein